MSLKIIIVFPANVALMLVLNVKWIHSISKGLFGFNDFNLVKLQ